MINILYEDNHCIAVEKPVNIPTQADRSGDTDLMRMVKDYLIEKYDKPGEAYLGLVSRLDRPVGGVIVFAKTSKAAARLSAAFAKHEEVTKTYLAVIDSPELPHKGEYIDYMVKDTKTNMSRVCRKDEEGAKLAKLSFECLGSCNGHSLALIHLETGRPHQIRVQFSSRFFPLWGDQRYNKLAKSGQQLALWSYELVFPQPVTKEPVRASVKPRTTGPWADFKAIINKL